MSWFSFILGLNSFFLLFLDMVIKTEPQHIHVYPGLQVSKCDISSPLKRGGDFVTEITEILSQKNFLDAEVTHFITAIATSSPGRFPLALEAGRKMYRK